MADNNPATSGVDMSPELLLRMFEAVDNVPIGKESTVTFRRTQRIDELSGGQLLSDNGSDRWCMAAPCLRPPPCIDLHDAVRACELPRAQAIYTEPKHSGNSSWRALWPPPLEFIDSGIGHPCRPLPPLDDEGRAALQNY